mmetsp:Transcript_43/g.161  ORF Transcript_43/g.161 Transcript_43/m.161 type:complete len:200 (-) Transcript_43:358-957(-)
MTSLHRGSVRKTLRTPVGILEVNFCTSSWINKSWCLMRPCHTLSNLFMSTPPYVASAACRARTMSSRARLFCTKTVKSSGVGLQNWCDDVTHRGCDFAFTLTPRSISACTARGLPAKAAKCSKVKPQTPPLESSVQISSSSCCASTVTLLASSPIAASTSKHQKVLDDGTDKKLSLRPSSPLPASANARRMKSLFWSYP